MIDRIFHQRLNQDFQHWQIARVLCQLQRGIQLLTVADFLHRQIGLGMFKFLSQRNLFLTIA